MKVKELEYELSSVKPFAKPKLELEQYATDAHVAARMLYTAQTTFEDIEDKVILDLGCGCGMLSIAAIMMGAKHVVGVDIDVDAQSQCRSNLELMEIEEGPLVGDEQDDEFEAKVELINVNVLDTDALDKALSGRHFETVILNPPFGTKDNAGIDMHFLEVALKYADKAVYSLHKSSTRDYITRKAKESWKCKDVQVLAQIKFEIKNQFSFHKKDRMMVDVDLIRLGK